MRYGPALAIAVVAIFLISAVPFVANDSEASNPYADPYVDFDHKIQLRGCVTGFDISSESPKAYLFVVIEDGGVFKYINYNESDTDTSPVTAPIASDNTFTFIVPTITAVTAEYYIWFDLYSIKNVPWKVSDIENGVESIEPEHPSWPDSIKRVYPSAYKIPHANAWDTYPSYDPDHPSQNEFWITDKTPTESGVITLQRSMGTVTGHVSNTVRGDLNDLADVRVEIFSNGRQILYTDTDSKGNYTFDVPTGSYELTFNRGNYHHSAINIEVVEGDNKAPEVTMELEMDNSYFGYDLVHFLMFIGAGICVLIIILSIGFQYKRMKMNRSGREWILDDMPEEDDD
jgi:hypothetical protein